MLRPDNQPGSAHFFGGGKANLVGAAEHPRQHIYAVREDHDALGAHLPESACERLFVQRMDIGHSQQIRRVAVHDHMVLRVDFEPFRMAHHVGGELGGKASAIGEAPEEHEKKVLEARA